MSQRTKLLFKELEKNGRLASCYEGTAQAYLPTAFSENHAPSLLELENGDLLAVWFAGGTEEGRSDINIVMSRLNSGEVFWTNEVLLSDDDNRSEQNPVLFQAEDGSLMLLHTSQEARNMSSDEFKQKFKGKPFTMQETSRIICRISHDNGYTWGPKFVFSDKPGSFCRSPITVLSNGDWLFPMWYSVADGETHYGSDYSVVKISENKGKDWSEYIIPGSRGRVHASVVETESGNLTAFFRSRSADRIYISRSHDFGRTWSPPERTILPNNNSSIRAIRLHSGRLAIIFNDFSANDNPEMTVWPKQRYPVTVALSEDGGNTWPYMRHIDHGDGFCGKRNSHLNQRYEYPWLLQTRDGLLHATYAWGSRQCIKHVIFTENWIIGTQ